MPSRNIIKQYAPESYYHIYSRGVNKQSTFKSEEDYEVFISLFKRYLSPRLDKDIYRHNYPNYCNRIELLAYALMPNHIHLFVYQQDEYAIRDFMRSIMTSYSMYFNKKNNRIGPVFQSRYKANRVTDEAYFQHISRYIHLNPKEWKNSNKTSIDFYSGKRRSSWVRPDRVLELFDNNRQEYLKFVADYEGQKEVLDELKWELADS